MPDATTLREFVLKLGFQTDEQSQMKFNETLASMTNAVMIMGEAAVAASAAVVAGVAKIAESYESLHYLSDKTQSSIGDIKAFEFALQHVGASAGQAETMLESLGNAAAANPGFKQLIEHYTGKQYTDAATALEDLGLAFKHMAASGEVSMPVILKIGESMHLSQQDMQVLLRNYEGYIDQYKRLAAINPDQNSMGTNAVEFMNSLRTLGTEISEVYGHIANDIEPSLTKGITGYEQVLEANAPKIIKLFDDVAIEIGKLDIGKLITTAGTDITTFITDIQALDKQFHDAAKSDSGMGQFLHVLEEIMTFMNSLSTNKLFTVIAAMLEGLHVQATGNIPTAPVPPDLDSQGGAFGPGDPNNPQTWLGTPMLPQAPGEQPATGFTNWLNSMADHVRNMFPSGHASGNAAINLNDPRVKEAYDQLLQLGRSPSAASGMVSQMYSESGMDAGIVNASGHAGLGQWSLERQNRFHAFLRDVGIRDHNLMQSTFREQVEFYDWELKHYEPQANDILNRATTPEQGALGGIANERPEGYVSPAEPGPLYFGRASNARRIQQAMSDPSLRHDLEPSTDVVPNIQNHYDLTAMLGSTPLFAGGSPYNDVKAMSGDTINNYAYNFSAPQSDPQQAAQALSNELNRRANADLIRNALPGVL